MSCLITKQQAANETVQNRVQQLCQYAISSTIQAMEGLNSQVALRVDRRKDLFSLIEMTYML